jgi:hypothetical protein
VEQLNKTAFISYSWDSTAHQEWVIKLANKLRREGIEANVDVFLTQSGTVNLNTMMVTNMRNNDFVIIVLTENYAKKADEFQGGVGFETTLSLPVLRKNPDKFIFILRHQGNFEKAFPFHLDGYYAIDFSNDSQFEVKFRELIHRVRGVPLYKIEPVGMPGVLEPRDLEDTNSPVDFFDIEIPNLNRITDRDIERFMKESFKQIVQLLNTLFKKIQSVNPNFEFDQDEINNYKTIFKLYVDGVCVNGLKIWFGGVFGSNSINILYGSHIDINNDSSLNESITYEIDRKNRLKLKLSFNMYGSQDAETPEEIVKRIWENHLVHSIK